MREFIRHPLSIPISCDSPADKGRKDKFLSNIGEGGLAFISASCHVPDDLVRISIVLATEEFSITGLVVWCRKLGSCFEVGVKFEDDRADFAIRLVEQACYIEEYRQQALENEDRVLTVEEAAFEWIRKNAARFPR